MALRLISVLGGPMVRAGLVVQSALALLLWRKWRLALFLAATVTGTGAINTGLKKVVARKRPRSIVVFRRDDKSFPSGHTSGTTALAGALAYIVWLLTGRLVMTLGVSLAGAVVAGIIGYTRVTLHRHHTSDVAAGYALGVGCLLAAIALDRRARR